MKILGTGQDFQDGAFVLLLSYRVEIGKQWWVSVQHKDGKVEIAALGAVFKGGLLWLVSVRTVRWGAWMFGLYVCIA